MFDRLERVLYRSLEMTVTTKRIALRDGDEYRIRDISAMTPEVWSEMRSIQEPYGWRKWASMALAVGGSMGLFFVVMMLAIGLVSGFGGSGPSMLEWFIGVSTGVVVTGGLFVSAWWISKSGPKQRVWFAEITLYLGDEEPEIISLTSPLDLDDAVAAIEEAMAS